MAWWANTIPSHFLASNPVLRNLIAHRHDTFHLFLLVLEKRPFGKRTGVFVRSDSRSLSRCLSVLGTKLTVIESLSSSTDSAFDAVFAV